MCMPIRVIDELELVYIDQGQSERFILLSCLVQGTRDLLLIGAVIAECGQVIDQSGSFELVELEAGSLVQLALIRKHFPEEHEQQDAHCTDDAGGENDQALGLVEP